MFSHPVVRFTVCLAALIPFVTQAEEEHWYNYDHLHFEAGTYIHYDPDDGSCRQPAIYQPGSGESQ